MPAAMRSMWKGSVSFGLVNVPVKMYTATSSKDVTFHQVHAADGGRIRYKRTCQVCGDEVAFSEIAKGYESPDGQQVVLTEDDLAELPVAGSREIDVDRFVPAEQIDPMLLEKSYYLEPEKAGRKAYALLREVLADSDRVALVSVAIRSRSTLAVLRVRDDVIVLQTMMWPDEVRAADFEDLPSADELRPQEVAMAASLVDSMTGDYDADDFSDSYREAVETLVASKLGDAPAPVEETPAPAGGGEVIDLLAALQRSVDEAKATRAAKGSAQDDSSTGVEAAKGGVKVSGAKTAAAKTAAAKSAGAKSPGAAKDSPSAGTKGAPTKGAAATKSTPTARTTATKGTAAKRTTAERGAAAKGTAGKGPAGKATAGKATTKDTAGKATTKDTVKKSA